MDSYYFRANVAALIIRGDQVLAFQRKDHPDTWQCPQGGYDVGEGVVAAAWREVAEETGLTQTDLVLKAEHPEWLSYGYPEGEQFGSCIGQTQKWFTFEFIGSEENITLDQHEFISWKWMSFEELKATVPEFKRSVYAKLGVLLSEIYKTV
jgi:putative (di)nucleoside polyphosphate hydrolase